MNYKLIITCLIILTPMLILKYIDHDIEKLELSYPRFNTELNKYELNQIKPVSWVHINEISNISKWAILVSEDWAFYQHKGVDYQQLKIVLKESFQTFKLARGASTITQQVVKNVFLNSNKSLWRKIKEFIYATRIEKIRTKDQILETYINLIELGPNIYGIKEASKVYFNKEPKNLTAKEGAFLAMLLPSPVKYSQSFRNQKLTPFAIEVIESILVKLRQAKVYSEGDRLTARAQILFINDDLVEGFDPVENMVPELDDDFYGDDSYLNN